jgi:hypothetical protein
MNWFVQGIVLVLGAGLGVAATIAADMLRKRIDSRGGELTGEWREILSPGYHKEYEREDEVRVFQKRHSGRFSAEFKRNEPETERGRRWRASGLVQGNEAVAIFWPIGAGHDGSSFGVAILHRDPSGLGKVWRGFYIRPGTDVGRDSAHSNLEPVPLVWRRR